MLRKSMSGCPMEFSDWRFGRIVVHGKWELLPSRELTYPTKREKEKHLQNAILGGYVNSLEGIPKQDV